MRRLLQGCEGEKMVHAEKHGLFFFEVLGMKPELHTCCATGLSLSYTMTPQADDLTLRNILTGK